MTPFLAIVVTGCWTEVPYEEEGAEPGQSETAEAETATEPIDDEKKAISDGSANKLSSKQRDDLEQTDNSPEQALGELTRNEPNEPNETKSLLPWQTSGASDETPDLFSKSKPIAPQPQESKEEEATDTNANQAKPSDDEFGSFLAEQYEGLLEEQAIDQESNKSADEPPAIAPSTTGSRYAYQPNPLPGSLKIPKLKKPPSNKKLIEKKSDLVVERKEDDFLFDPIEQELADPKPDALASLADEPANLETLPSEVPVPVDEPLAENSETTLMPWDLPAEKAPDKLAESVKPSGEDRYQKEFVEADPLETSDEPLELPEPEKLPVATLMPKAPTITKPEATRLASLDPLPAVPVLRYNTRHMAWLLGGKLGLARLAELEGATPSEVLQWTTEARRLADQLEVPIPTMESSSDSIGQRVTALLAAAAEASDSMAKAHGTDHAALLEISLKTNALLVMCKKYPELAAPTAKAVEKAAERAELPGFLWRNMTKALLIESSPDEIFESVTEMHDNVESYLR